MIIGVTGYLASGKDTVAEYLIKKGYNHYSCSDELRAILKQRNLESNRENQVKLGNELREQYGPGYLAQIILDKAQSPAVITSIRTPGEVETLKKNKDFFLIFVDAPIEMRYQRVIARKREGDEKLSFEQFQAQEQREKQNADKNKQQLTAVAQMADFIIKNDNSLQELYTNIDKIIKKVTI